MIIDWVMQVAFDLGWSQCPSRTMLTSSEHHELACSREPPGGRRVRACRGAQPFCGSKVKAPARRETSPSQARRRHEPGASTGCPVRQMPAWLECRVHTMVAVIAPRDRSRGRRRRPPRGRAADKHNYRLAVQRMTHRAVGHDERRRRKLCMSMLVTLDGSSFRSGLAGGSASPAPRLRSSADGGGRTVSDLALCRGGTLDRGGRPGGVVRIEPAPVVDKGASNPPDHG
jgi:hypothetical protein